MGGRYPPMSPALPSHMQPTRAARVLRPSVVLITLAIMLVSAILGLAIGIARFKEERVTPFPASISACQGFVIVGSGCSMVYVLAHIIATIHNEPIGDVRPPENRLHAACFILAKLGLVLWGIGIITSAVVVARPGICTEASEECRLQLVDLVVANLSFVGMGILLTALGSCRYPFELPEAFATGVNCRVSDFGDDILERSVSNASSFESRSSKKAHKTEMVESIEKETAPTGQPNSPHRPVPGEFPRERRLTPLLPMIPVSKASAWSEEVKQLVNGGGLERKPSKRADSAISLGSETSSDSGRSTSDRGSRAPAGKRRLPPRPRPVKPSSSISNESRRSPLSRMRSAEFPDIIIQEELQFLPVSIPPPEKWSVNSRGATASRPSTAPNAMNITPRIPIAIPPKSAARKPGYQLKPIARKPAPSPVPAPIAMTRRNTADIKVPGAFIDYRPSFEDEQKLEEHARKILEGIKSRPQNTGNSPRSSPSIEGSPIDSRSRYREQRPGLQRASSTTVAAKRKEVNSAAKSHVRDNRTGRVRPLRRLTLADVSPKLDGIFDELAPDPQ